MSRVGRGTELWTKGAAMPMPTGAIGEWGLPGGLGAWGCLGSRSGCIVSMEIVGIIFAEGMPQGCVEARAMDDRQTSNTWNTM